MYALICGHLPFDDQNTNLLYQKIMKGNFLVPSYVSIEATSLIKCILNVDP